MEGVNQLMKKCTKVSQVHVDSIQEQVVKQIILQKSISLYQHWAAAMSSEEGGEDTRVKMETETITVSVPNDDSASLISQPARVQDK